MRKLYVIHFAILAAELLRAGETSLVFGGGWLYARQQVDLQFSNRVETVDLRDIPEGADPLSFQIFPRFSPVELVEWTRSAGGSLRAVLRTDDAGLRSFDAACLVRGPSWQASYQLVVRADPEREDTPVSVDVDGRITIRNHGGGSWSNARVRLVGATLPPSRDRAGTAGILSLDESSPLSDLWRGTPPQAPREFAYEMDRPINVNSGEERSYTFISTTRRPAARRYILDSDEIAFGGAEPGGPLRRVIAIANDVGHGLGRDLPGGTAQIYLGSVRSTFGQTAWFDRTPAGGEIRIEMGRADGIRAIRRSVSSEPGAPGEVNDQFEIVIRNNLASIARVEISEEPPVPRAWEVLRSNQSYEIRNRRLHFQLDVPAGESSIIRYITRSHAPKL